MPTRITRFRLQILLEAEFSSWLYGTLLHRTFHYHPSSRYNLHNDERGVKHQTIIILIASFQHVISSDILYEAGVIDTLPRKLTPTWKYLPPLFIGLGLLLMESICSLWEQMLSVKGSPQEQLFNLKSTLFLKGFRCQGGSFLSAKVASLAKWRNISYFK